MSATAISSRLEPLAPKHRIAHLVALIRGEREGSTRAAELTASLHAQLAAVGDKDGRPQ